MASQIFERNFYNVTNEKDDHQASNLVVNPNQNNNARIPVGKFQLPEGWGRNESRRKRIYIAGPMTASTQEKQKQNTLVAMGVKVELRRRGWNPYLPHYEWFLDYHYPEHVNLIAYEERMEIDFEWLLLCEALYLIEHSPGATREYNVAKSNGLALYHNLDEVPYLPLTKTS